MKFSGMLIVAFCVMLITGSGNVSAEDGRHDFEFNSPAFSFGFNVPDKKGLSDDLAPLDDDFSDKGASPAPIPYSDNRQREYQEYQEYSEPAPRNNPSFKDGYRDEEYSDRRDNRDSRDRADGRAQPDQDELVVPSTRLALGCLSRQTISRNLRAGGWHNFRSYNTNSRRVKVTADNPVGMPFRLTVDRCTGAILFARLL